MLYKKPQPNKQKTTPSLKLHSTPHEILCKDVGQDTVEASHQYTEVFTRSWCWWWAHFLLTCGACLGFLSIHFPILTCLFPLVLGEEKKGANRDPQNPWGLFVQLGLPRAVHPFPSRTHHSLTAVPGSSKIIFTGLWTALGLGYKLVWGINWFYITFQLSYIKVHTVLKCICIVYLDVALKVFKSSQNSKPIYKKKIFSLL